MPAFTTAAITSSKTDVSVEQSGLFIFGFGFGRRFTKDSERFRSGDSPAWRTDDILLAEQVRLDFV
jgi:hypothetical protein